jgi:hypothetical protein
MQQSKNVLPSGGSLGFCLLLLNAIVLERGLVAGGSWYRWLWVTVPLYVISLFVLRRKGL